MTLTGSGTVYVCRPDGRVARRYATCPNCKRRRRFTVALYAWYSPTWTCCACGDAYSDGERLPRPFAPGWRAAAIREARADWAAAIPFTEASRWAIREAVGPWRIQRRRTKGWRLPEGAVCVTRPGRWGNPFVPFGPLADGWAVVFHGDVYADRLPTRTDAIAAAVDLYALHVGPFGSIETDPADIREALGGKHLACWCREATPCHGDVLLAIANGWPLPAYVGEPAA